MKKALITGITGQDGYYLAYLLLKKKYKVFGITLPGEELTPDLQNSVMLFQGNLADNDFIKGVITSTQPDEMYNLGAQSNVRKSFEMSVETGEVSGLAVIKILEIIRKFSSHTRFYQASSCEMFGPSQFPQSELTPFNPLNPYASAKVYAYHSVRNYRQAYGLFMCSGILFHHESPRRSSGFVTKKIVESAVRILKGEQDVILLGNLEAKRDWGFAPEYVQAMWKMLQQDSPEDYVIGTGLSHSVRDFINYVFSYLGLSLLWTGSGIAEMASIAMDTTVFGRQFSQKRNIVKVSKDYFRPVDISHLQADTTKAVKRLNWNPLVTFSRLVEIMVDYDLIQAGLKPMGKGLRFCEQNGFEAVFHDNHYVKGKAWKNLQKFI